MLVHNDAVRQPTPRTFRMQRVVSNNTMLTALLRRAPAVHMTQPIAAEALRAMLLLRDGSGDEAALEAAFIGVSKRQMPAVNDALSKIKVDHTRAEHGHRVAMMCACLTRMRCDEIVWQGVTHHVVSGLNAGVWPTREVRSMLLATARWGVYPTSTLPPAVEKYVGSKASHADQLSLVDLAQSLSALTENHSSSVHHAIVQRLALLADVATPGTLGGVCRGLLRARFKDGDTMSVVKGQLQRIVAGLDEAGALGVLGYWALHDYSGTMPVTIPENATRREAQEAAAINSQATQTQALLADLLRKNVEELSDNVGSLTSLLRSLRALSTDQWLAVTDAADSALEAAAIFCQELLAAEDAAQLGAEDLCALMPKFFQAVRDRPARLMPLEAAPLAMDAFARHAAGRAEDLMAHESAPFFLVTCLLGAADTHEACREGAISLLLEAKEQDLALPTLQTFRFMLAFADSGSFDPRLTGYLRHSFGLTLQGIPLVQLVTALRCLVIAEKDCRSEGDERVALDDFLTDVGILLKHGEHVFDVRLTLALGAALSELVLPASEPAGRLTDVVVCNLTSLCVNAAPQSYSSVAAQGCMKFLEATEVPDEVATFLKTTIEEGAKNEPDVKPSKWMRDNDPSSAILPRTPQEVKLDAVLKDIRGTRVSDAERIAKLGAEYTALLDDVHPDNVRFLFELFAERVIKQDAILRDAMKHLIKTGAVERLSGFSVASILGCSAQVRFAYYKQTKDMLNAITEEQWGNLDPIELELILSALSRLSIRIPRVLLALSERAIELAPQMQPRHIASVIAALQGVGVHDEAVYGPLLARVAEVAPEMAPTAVAVLLGGTNAYRLPLTETVAKPLVARLVEVSSDLPPHMKTRIGTTLKKSTLPRELLEGASERLLIE